MTIWCIHNNVLHTTNNGFDSDEYPIIPFLEFLQDIAQVGNKEYFIKLTNDMLKNDEDIKLLPKKMFMMLLKDISLFRANYDEWKDYTKFKFAVKKQFVSFFLDIFYYILFVFQLIFLCFYNNICGHIHLFFVYF